MKPRPAPSDRTAPTARTAPFARAAATAAVVPLTLLALVGCGSGTDLEPGSTLTAGEFKEIYLEGVENSTTAETKFENKGGILDQSGTGVVDFTGDEPASRTEATGGMFGDQTVTTVMVDGTSYVQLPMGGGSSQKWFKTDLQDLAGGAGIDVPTDPEGGFALLEPGIEEVTYVGEEEVGDDDTDHYEYTVDVTKTDMAGVAPQMPETIDVDVWLDEENRVRKQVQDMGALGTSTNESFNWGTDVEIEAPPADQVSEMPAVPGMG